MSTKTCNQSVATAHRGGRAAKTAALPALLAWACLALAAGCGQKGGLVLPGAPPQAVGTPVDAPAPAPAPPAGTASAPVRP